MFIGNFSNSLMIVDKAKIYTNSIHGLNSPANRVTEFLVGKKIITITLPFNIIRFNNITCTHINNVYYTLVTNM